MPDEILDVVVDSGPVNETACNRLHSYHAGMSAMKLLQDLPSELARNDYPVVEQYTAIDVGERLPPVEVDSNLWIFD